MEITVIGHLCKDRILFEGESQPAAVQFGGLIYSVAALSAASRIGDVIRPVCSVGVNEFEEARALLLTFPFVSVEGVFPVNGPTNEVTHIYGSPGTPRIECSVGIADPIPFTRVKPFLEVDGVLVNMVSGLDVTLETFDNIRMAVRDRRVPIHFDFHALTLGIDGNSKRFRRPLTDWRRWCFMLHSVQMSEQEALGLTAEKYDEKTLINQLMPLMVQGLAITRGEQGVTLITQDVHKHLTRHDIPGVPVTAVDTTGCGDVFGATFFASAILNTDFRVAAERANTVAALHASLPVQNKAAAIVERARGFAAPAMGSTA